ncbi:MAG: signal transduction histidine kinase/DNA-binding response OmpR family regulator [Crocinitomix sp.]|jgi:signal transduction histidine kinase/DNA-binding response OmpR family regulator
MIKTILLSLAILMSYLNTYGQIYSRQQLDKLEIQLEQEKGIPRINTLLELSEGYNQFNLNTATNYAKEAAVLSKKFDYDWGYYKSLYCATKSAKENNSIYTFKPILKSCVLWFNENGYGKDAFFASSIYIECVRQTEKKEISQNLAIEALNEAKRLQDDELLGNAWYGAARHELSKIDAYYKYALDSAKFYRKESSDSSSIMLTEMVKYKAGTKEAFEAYYDGYEKAKSWENSKLRCQATLYLANGYASVSNVDSTNHYIKETLNEAVNYGSSRQLGRTYRKLGFCYWAIGDSTNLLDALLMADSITDKLGYYAERIIGLRTLSSVLITNGDYQKGIHFTLQSIELAELLEENIEKIKLQFNLGHIYSLLFEYDKAEEILLANRHTIDELPDTDYKIKLNAQNNHSLGLVYAEKGQHERALEIFKAERENLKGTNEIELILIEHDILDIYVHDNDLENAEKQLDVLLGCDENLLKNPGFTIFKLVIGHTRILQKRYAEGVALINEYLETSQLDEMNKNHMLAYDLLCIAYKNLGEFEKGIEVLEKSNFIEENIKNKIKNKTLKIQSDYEIAQKEAEIEDLKKQQEIQDLKLIQESNTSRIRQQLNLIMGIVVVFILTIGYFIFRRARLKKEKNELLMKSKQIQLEFENIESKQKTELAEVKNSLFANISHEFRTPLTLIKVPIENLKNRENNADKALLDGVLHNADELLKMVDELLELGKMTSGEVELNESVFNLEHLFTPIRSNFKFLFIEKRIVFDWNNSLPKLAYRGDENRLKIVLNNLLKNAYSHTSNKGTVSCQIKQVENGGVHIIVTNTGDNIAREDYPYIFDRYYRANEEKYVGNGIGLSLCKEIIELHGGKIYVDNSLENSVSFHVELPPNRIVQKLHETVEPEIKQGLDQTKIDSTKLILETDGILPHLLVVEDNAEMRDLIAVSLKGDFRISFAENGEIGEQKAIENQPDLIISDVMMPVKDGFELLNILKNNFETSHIPIILLTAKAGSESRIQGLDQDADDYLVKPFNPKELKARVNNLVRQREQLQKLFTENPLHFISKSSSISKLDADFLKNAQLILDTNYSNGDFTVNEFCQELALNRNSVHIKIKTYTGEGTATYIKNFRLKKVIHLLDETKKSIADICFECGFNSSQAFNQIFKKEFKLTPGQFRNRKK